MAGKTLRWPDGERLPEALRAALMGPGAPFELVVDDVGAAQLEVFARRRKDLRQLLVEAASRFGDRPYLTFPERSYTFASVVPAVASVAAALRDRYGVGKGDRVAIAAANCAEWVITFWAATSLGAITVALNGWWTGAEMAYGLELTRPSVLVGDERRLARLAGTDHGVATVRLPFDLEDHAPGAELAEAVLDEDDPFLILFTSGTTGRPKGALISHRGNIHFIMSTLLTGAAGVALSNPSALGQPPADQPCMINASPLFHVAGLNCQVVMATATGMHIVYPPQGRWQEETQLRLTEAHRATSWSVVPTQLWRILEHPGLDRYDLSSLTSVGGGSSVWAPELLRTLAERLPSVRPRLGMGYGSTETNGLGTTHRPPWNYERPDAIGYPGSAVELQIRGPATEGATAVAPGEVTHDGPVLGDGEVGEICLRTAATFLGYWDNPAATEAALDPDRWYRTGDFGHTRDGFVYLEGRRQDLIIRGGENIYPAEIENRLLEHPAIAEAAVIGASHPALGQEVKAVIVLHPSAHPGTGRDSGTSLDIGTGLDAAGARAWVREALAGFKVPTQVEFVDALPYNATGKVMKHLLESPSSTSGFIPE